MARRYTPPCGARPPGLIQRYQWLRRFLRFHKLRHPREMGSEDVNAPIWRWT
jgi:hypothetical protein